MKRSVLVWLVLCGLASSTQAFAQAPKVDVCHVNGSGIYKEITVSRNGLSAHLKHGDGVVGDPVPGMAGYSFGAACEAVLAQPNFEPFYIRNNNSLPLPERISPPWDADMNITENAVGDGFEAAVPRAGQKVGYGTSFFDNLPINAIETVSWNKVIGVPGLFSYLNIWVTDGTNYAIIASENDYLGQDFSTRQEWKVFEFDGAGSLDWLCNATPATRVGQYLLCNGARATLSDIPSNVVILSPGMSPAPSYVGSGAPRAGYGFNLIFGDSLANFTARPYSLNNLTVTVGGITYFAKD